MPRVQATHNCKSLSLGFDFMSLPMRGIFSISPGSSAFNQKNPKTVQRNPNLKMWISSNMWFWKCEFCQTCYFENVNFAKRVILKMWISSNMWFWKCEFCQICDFENVNFVWNQNSWFLIPRFIFRTKNWIFVTVCLGCRGAFFNLLQKHFAVVSHFWGESLYYFTIREWPWLAQ